MSEMNSVSDLMATWAKFTLRGGLLGEITVTEMVSWERLLVRFNIFCGDMLSLCLLSGHFIGTGSKCLTTMLNYHGHCLNVQGDPGGGGRGG